MTVVDDLTVKMTLTTAYALWLNVLAGIYGVHFASPAYVKEHATDDDPWATDWMAEHACGTSPYTLVAYVPGDHLIMEKNPDYWRGWEGKDGDRIVERFAEEVVTHRELLETGEADWAQPPMPLEWQAASLRLSAVLRLQQRQCRAGFYLHRQPFHSGVWPHALCAQISVRILWHHQLSGALRLPVRAGPRRIQN